MFLAYAFFTSFLFRTQSLYDFNTQDLNVRELWHHIILNKIVHELYGFVRFCFFKSCMIEIYKSPIYIDLKC